MYFAMSPGYPNTTLSRRRARSWGRRRRVSRSQPTLSRGQSASLLLAQALHKRAAARTWLPLRTTSTTLGQPMWRPLGDCCRSSAPAVSARPPRACAAPGGAEAGRQVAATTWGGVIRTTRVRMSFATPARCEPRPRVYLRPVRTRVGRLPWSLLVAKCRTSRSSGGWLCFRSATGSPWRLLLHGDLLCGTHGVGCVRCASRPSEPRIYRWAMSSLRICSIRLKKIR